MTVAAGHLLALIAALREQADVWQDSERQEAEQRLDVDAADLAVLDDERYATVLSTIHAARTALDELQWLAGPGNDTSGGAR